MSNKTVPQRLKPPAFRMFVRQLIMPPTKKTSKLRITDVWWVRFRSQRANNTENVFLSWRHHLSITTVTWDYYSIVVSAVTRELESYDGSWVCVCVCVTSHGASSHRPHDYLSNTLLRLRNNNNYGNTKAVLYWPLMLESTGDRSIPHTKTQSWRNHVHGIDLLPDT